MRGTNVSLGVRAALIVFSVTLFATTTWAASEKKLHNFGNGSDGAYPQGALISDGAGGFYGTTPGGGVYGGGTVFELGPTQGGGWWERDLFNFGHATDGVSPQGNLIMDASGNLYGVTSSGGVSNYGTVFELVPGQDGHYAEKRLYNFNWTNGATPVAGLIMDEAGNLYGTTNLGGSYGWGTVFELSPRQDGSWTGKKLHNFDINGSDGYAPAGSLIMDALGNLYGTTYLGGAYNSGTAFELLPRQGGSWTEKKLHNFGNENDGANPNAGLVADNNGNLYGTTNHGGRRPCTGNGCGTVFELTSDGSGGWTEKRLHDFGDAYDGTYPLGNLIVDGVGNLYGTTYQGGTYAIGTVFELSPNGSGGFTERKLHNFRAQGTDGLTPQSGLIMDAAGALYGTTSTGGDYGYGTAFEITP